jgi:hypothetical protein
MPSMASTKDKFPNLSGLSEDAAAKMRRAYLQLHKAGAEGAALRLTAVDTEIGNGNRNYEDLEWRVDPERTVDELNRARGWLRWGKLFSSDWFAALRSFALGLPRSVRAAHLFRNVFALAPLVLTWYMLGQAAAHYENAFNSGHANSKPFLLLWQAGFSANSWSFETVTVIDVCLLLFVAVLTWWAHWAERQTDWSAGVVYDAMDSLMVTLAHYSAVNPTSAADWANAAKEVLARGTAQVEKAMEQAEAAAARLEGLQDTNQKWLEGFQEKTRQLLKEFSDGTLDALKTVRKDNEAFIESATKANQEILQKFMGQIIDKQVQPLLGDLRDMLGDLRTQQAACTSSVTALTTNVAAIQTSAKDLAESARTFSGSTQAISGNLESMAVSQRQFATHVEGSAQSMKTASAAMTDVKDALQADLQQGIQTMSRNVTDASESLKMVQAGLAATTRALEASSGDLKKATANMVIALREAGPMVRPRGRRKWYAPWLRSDGFGEL